MINILNMIMINIVNMIIISHPVINKPKEEQDDILYWQNEKSDKRSETMDVQKGQEMSDAALARRDFLCKSVYAACATPVIMSLLVEKADAAQSWNPGRGTRPPNQSIGPDGGANNSGHAEPRPERWNPEGPGNR